MKKFLSLVLALVMTMSLVTVSAGAKDFDDNEAIQYAEAVAVMSDVKVIDGYADGSFKPANTLTRQAAAKIICNLILGPTTAAALHADTAPYKDVPVTSDFAGYITYCAQQGIISGYADGSFRPGNTLTGYAFMKMLLGALGYDADAEAYVGANWSVNVAKRALGIGLNAGLKDSFNGVKAVTREEACLYAFNTLKATMVDYEAKTTVNVGGANVVIAGSAAQEVANNARVEGIKEDNKLQFAEKYFTKLSVATAVDAFERPCNLWKYNKDEIGTFVDYTQLVASYTTAVSGKELYDVVGSSAYKGYDFAAYVDGVDEGDFWKEISKNNKKDVTYTGNGALVEVFVNNDTKNGDVIVTVINTYLAKATMDYNAKKDSVTYEIFGMNGAYDGKVSGEDFDIEDVEAGDFALVTYSKSEKAIQSISDVEIIEDTEISKFTSGSNITVDGDKYSYSLKAAYEAGVLDYYTGEEADVTNLKDITYNIFLDAYGYVIGIEEVSAPTNYLFVTGFDMARSNLANKTWTANAIFMDGTDAEIQVKKGAEAFAKYVDADGKFDAVVNSWFSYTVNSDDVYTLTEVSDKNGSNSGSVYQNWDATNLTNNADRKLDSKHVALKTDNGKSVYGNDNTVYLLAGLDVVNGEVVIAEADEVITGHKNVDYTSWTATKVAGEMDTANSLTYGVYALYKTNGYVTAAVVVGESATVSTALAYLPNNRVSAEGYDKTTGTWTWTRDAIIDGELVELVETNDEGVSALKTDKDGEKFVEGDWVTVKYLADDTVKELVKLVPDKDEIYTAFTGAVAAVEKGESPVVLASKTLNQYHLDGNTLFMHDKADTGFMVAEDVKIVLKQNVKNVWDTDYTEGAATLKAILKDLNEDEDGTHAYLLDAVIEDGFAKVVIIVDKVEDNGYKGPNGSTPDGYDAEVKIALRKVTVTGPKAWNKDDADLRDAIIVAAVNALAEEGYEVTKMVTEGDWTFTAKNVESGTDAVEFYVQYVEPQA